MSNQENKEVKIKVLGLFSLECKQMTFKEAVLLIFLAGLVVISSAIIIRLIYILL